MEFSIDIDGTNSVTIKSPSIIINIDTKILSSIKTPFLTQNTHRKLFLFLSIIMTILFSSSNNKILNMKITAFAGSNSSHSINRQLVKFALSYFQNTEVNLLDLNDFEMPIFSVDREELGYPNQAYEFAKAMDEADFIVCSLAENNRSYSTAFKNVFDWCSRIDLNIFKGKPMFLMSTSPGRYGGESVMNAAKSFFPACGANIIATFSLPRFYQTFDGEKGIIDATLLNEFEEIISLVNSKIDSSN